jgi:hypothetical protein
VPWPFSRARAIPSPEIFIPPALDREGIEFYRQKVERLLNDLTSEAEAWAESGERRRGEQRVIVAPAPRHKQPPARPESRSNAHAYGLIGADGPDDEGEAFLRAG